MSNLYRNSILPLQTCKSPYPAPKSILYNLYLSCKNTFPEALSVPISFDGPTTGFWPAPCGFIHHLEPLSTGTCSVAAFWEALLLLTTICCSLLVRKRALTPEREHIQGVESSCRQLITSTLACICLVDIEQLVAKHVKHGWPRVGEGIVQNNGKGQN